MHAHGMQNMWMKVCVVEPGVSMEDMPLLRCVCVYVIVFLCA